MPKRGKPWEGEGWWHGEQNGQQYEVLGHQLENGVRVEGLPDPSDMLPTGKTTAILVHMYPTDDPEAGRYFWVHNPMGGTTRDWYIHIVIAASRYGVDLEMDVND